MTQPSSDELSEGRFTLPAARATGAGDLPPAGGATGSGPATVPGYEIEGVLGRGGMGVVYKARHLALKRAVALKMVLAASHASPEHLARFRAEAEAVARLQHPGIVQIHEVGQADGRPYLALEYLGGGNLAERMRGMPQPPKQAAEMVREVARAIHFAHQNGIVHRDLKPANILLTPDGQLKVADFGLAKQLTAPAGQTATGEILGTPSYMAPEQAGGVTRGVGPAADVYALGAILYELLTGRPPFLAEGPVETVLLVLTAEPVPPRRLQPKAPRDLETICLKCLAKETGKRYPSAAALADDLQRFLDGEPIQARPVGATERVRKWARRRPTAAALVGVCLLALIGSVAAGLWYDARLRSTRAATLVRSLATADTAQVPHIIEELGPYRRWAGPLLVKMQESSPPGSRERLHASLALLPVDRGQADYLAKQLLTAGPDELLILRDALAEHGEELRGPYWAVLESKAASPGERFRAACALAAYDPDSPRWARVGRFVANALVAESPLLLGKWVKALSPVRARLVAPLGEIFRKGAMQPERFLATSLLAEYAADQPDVLAELVKDADARQYRVLLPALQAHRGVVVPLLKQELARSPAASATEAEKDSLARRQAQAAVALLQLGEPGQAWPLLRHGRDPRRRTFLVHSLGPLGADAALLVGRLEVEDDLSARRALVLSLGEYGDEQLPARSRRRLVPELVRAYRDHPDPGLHSAAGWLLRRWGEGEQCKKIDRELASGKGQHGRLWYANGEGQTFAIVRGPVKARLGSPATEPGRGIDEAPRQAVIRHSFAICTTEVTVEQFERFLRAHPDRPELRPLYRAKYSPVLDGPIIMVKWFQAAQYCNWLSKREGIPPVEWCYPSLEAIEKDKGDLEGMRPLPGSVRRKGYRLPTEEEWEHAARAGAETSRCYGHAEELLGHYARHLNTFDDRTLPVGSLKPNDLGLFDVHGNVWEWCQDRAISSAAGARGRKQRVLRGGSFGDRPELVRSAHRLFRSSPGNGTGFRVARTY